MASYQVLAVHVTGVPYAEIANATVQSITWELNGWGEATLTMPVTDAQAWSEFRPSYQTREEVQIWRNGRLIWWGIYVAGTADEQTLTITCYGLLWYLSRRYFGPVHSNAMPTLLTNGTFEHATVTTGWDVAAGITTTGSTTRRRTGSKSIKLETSGSGVTDYYIGQAVAVPTPARTRPLTFTATAWQYRETVNIRDNWDRGLQLTRVDGAGVSIDPVFDALAKPDEELGRWVRREASITLPAGAGLNVGVALFAPASGVVYWDDVVVTYEQRTGAIEGEDWSDYLRRIFNYGAGNSLGGTEGTPLWWGAPVGKSSVNITYTGTGGAAVGSLRADLAWNHADEGNIFTALAELPARNLLDFEVTWPTDGRSRTLTAWTPRKGSTKAGLAAEQGRNIVTFRYDVDGRRRASDVRVTGRSAGKIKEVGQAGGPSVADAWQYESIISPPFEIDGQALIDQATSELSRLAEPVKTPTITVQAGMYMGDGAEAGAPLEVGDTIPIRITHGWIVEAANRRVVKMTLKPETETLDLVFNEG